MSDEEKAFFTKYGFVVLRGLHSKEQTKEAYHEANKLIWSHTEVRNGDD